MIFFFPLVIHQHVPRTPVKPVSTPSAILHRQLRARFVFCPLPLSFGGGIDLPLRLKVCIFVGRTLAGTLSRQWGVSSPQISTRLQCKHKRLCSCSHPLLPSTALKKEHFISEHNATIFHATVLIFPDIMSAPAPHYEDNDSPTHPPARPPPKAVRISHRGRLIRHDSDLWWI